MSMYKNRLDEIEYKLQTAYNLISKADTTEIDAFYLAVEEAQGYIAESLDILVGRDREGTTPKFEPAQEEE